MCGACYPGWIRPKRRVDQGPRLTRVQIEQNFAYDVLAQRMDEPLGDLLSLAEVLPGAPSVYWGWRNLGVNDLTREIVAERLDDYVSLLVAKLG